MEEPIGRIGTVATLTIVAVIEAANESIKGSLAFSHLPNFMKSGFWNFVPLSLLILLFVAWIARVLLFKGPIVFFKKSTISNDGLVSTIMQEAAVEIADSPALINYRDSLEHAWSDVNRAFGDFTDSYKYLKYFWTRLEKSKNDLQFREMFPGLSLTESQVASVRTQFQNDGEKLRAALKDLSALLHFQFKD